jgi:hypothetical protein
VLAHVFAGGGAVLAPASVDFRESNGYLDVQWRTTVPPGGTVAILHYGIQREVADAAGARAQAEALVALADADALAGLTPEERAWIVNFNLGAMYGSVEGHVVAADGTTPVSGARVQVINAATGQPAATTATGAEGQFSFPRVFVDAPDFIVRASLATDGEVRVEQPLAFAGTGDARTVTLVLPVATGTIQGVVREAGGQALGGVLVEVAATPGGASIAWTTAGPTGSYVISGAVLPAAGFYVRARVPGLSTTYEVAASLGGSGTIDVPLTLPIARIAVTGTVRAGDGQTPVPGAAIIVKDGAVEVARGWTDETGRYELTGLLLPTAGFSVVARYELSEDEFVEATATATPTGTTATVDVVLPLSVLRGTVTDGNGLPVPGLEAFAIGSDLRTRWNQGSGASSYLILGLPAGGFTLYLQDGSTGVTANRAGVLEAGQALVIDVALPRTSTLTGRVLDSRGLGVSGAWVQLLSASLKWERSAPTGVDGTFQFEGIPVGAVVVRTDFWEEDAQEQDVQRWASAAVEILDGIPANVELRPTGSGTVDGTLTEAGGATPISGAAVLIRSFVAGGAGVFETQTTTDPAGRYSAGEVPAGKIEVLALWTFDGDERFARAAASLTAGGTTTIDLAAGSGVALTFELIGEDTFKYDVQTSGRLGDGGTTGWQLSDAYNGAYELYVNEEGLYPRENIAGVELNGRQLVVGTAEAPMVQVTRKVFVPQAGGFARYLEILHNPLPIPVEAVVNVYSELGCDDELQALVAPSATGSTYAVTYGGGGGESGRPVLGHVFAGSAGVPRRPQVEIDPWGSMEYMWRETIPPGGSVAFLHFAIQRDPAGAGAGAVQAQAQALVNLTDANALAGLTDAERAMIVNFLVPPR